jgi:transposase
VRAGAPWRLLPTNFPPWPAVYQQARRWLDAGCFVVLVHDLRLLVRLALERGGQVTDDHVELAWVDQGYTGEEAARAAAHGIHLEVVQPPAATRGSVLLPHCWAVERDFAWASRFRRLARDYERLPAVQAGLHFVAFARLLLHRAVPLLVTS